MPRRALKTTAWLMIATLAIIGGVGEGLHFIPGCGHGVEVGDAHLFLGIRIPDGHQPPAAEGRLKRPDAPNTPVYDEDLCAICSAVGEVYSSAGPVQLILALPQAHDLPVVVQGEVDTESGRPFQARAPPIA